MVFQSYSLFPNMSALDNVGFGLRMRKIGAGERRKRAGDLLVQTLIHLIGGLPGECVTLPPRLVVRG